MSTYDLTERLTEFSIAIRNFYRSLPKKSIYHSDFDQLIRSSGSMGANYIEATEKLGRKDLQYRLRISLKEAKETLYWLKVIRETTQYSSETDELIAEANQLVAILITINNKLK